MDLHTGLICLAIVVFISVIIYIISVLFVKENSFEEAKATRKKLMKQYFDETRINNEKAKEKKSKKNKKAKEKTEFGKVHTSHSAIAITSESQATPDTDPTNEKNDVHNLLTEETKLNQNKDSKEQFINEKFKETKSAGQESEKNQVDGGSSSRSDRKEGKKNKAGVIGTQGKNDLNKKQGKGDKESTTIKPRDEALSDSTHISKGIPIQAVKPISTQVSKPSNSVNNNPSTVIPDDFVKELSCKESTNASTKKASSIQTLKVGKKKRNDFAALQQLSHDKDGVNINLLMSLLQKAELSRSEIQLLIDALLNMQQQESSEWLKGRQDPVVKIKKQLAEKEKALIDEKQATSGLQAKLKELRAELNNDKASIRQLEELVINKENEYQKLSTKLQQATEENQNLLLKTQQLQKQCEEQIVASKVKEEQIMQQKHHESILPLQSHVTTLAAQLQDQQEFTAKLQDSLRIKEDYNADLVCSLKTLQFDLKALQEQLGESRSENQNLQEENKTLRIENEFLTGQVQEARHLAELNESSSNENRENGEVTYAHKQDHEDFHAIIEEKETLLNQLNCELDQKERQIEKLNNDVITSKNESNKKQTILDNSTSEICKLRSQTSALKSDISEKEQILTEKNEEIVCLKKEIETNKQRNNDQILTEKNEEIVCLKKEIETNKQRNNELRNRNWKIMEALKSTEKELTRLQLNETSNSERTEKDGVYQLKEQIHDLFVRLFPGISIENNKDEQVWLKEIEEAAVTARSNLVPVSNSVAISDLENQNRQLQAMVSRYKEIIIDTEGMLNSLQAHVEVEETKWGEKIQSLQAELDSLKGPKHSKSNESYRSNGVSSATDNE